MPEKEDRKTIENKNSPPPTDLDQNDENLINQEYNSLDNAIDEINSALDLMEQKNDDIHQKLIELLESNKSIRQEMQTVNNPQNCNDTNME